jgi:hypothetical protein
MYLSVAETDGYMMKRRLSPFSVSGVKLGRINVPHDVIQSRTLAVPKSVMCRFIYELHLLSLIFNIYRETVTYLN